MELTRKNIESIITSRGLPSINPFEESPNEIYDFYYGKNNKCSICGNETKFLNFKNGYDDCCSRECRKLYLEKTYIPDFSNLLSKQELDTFITETYSSGNISNRMTYSYFIKNNKQKELNTLLYYIEDKKINSQTLYDLVHGKTYCSNCGIETTFINFKEGYRKTCSSNCSKNDHIKNEHLFNLDYIKANFIKNNQFLRDDMMKFYNCSSSFVNKYKEKNNITITNKKNKYTFGEQILFNEFKHLEIQTNSRNIINPYEIDFVIGNLCVEFDGLLFHSSGNDWPGNCSKRFKDKLVPKEYRLLTIFEDEFRDNRKDIWISLIKNKLNMNPTKIHARKCKIKEISARVAKDFCINNHLQGYCRSSVKLGLYYNEELVSVMTFRKHKKYQWEIARFCSKLNTSVIGGASKLLSYFEKKYKPNSLLSYANKRWSDGNLYENLGFVHSHDSAPNYFYFKVNKNILYPREMFQKHKLEDKLDSFDPELSETKNMYNNGYRKIYDYGNKVYLKYYKY